MTDRIAFKSAVATRKWGVRREVGGRFAALKYGKIIKIFEDSSEAHEYVQGCVEMDRAGA